MIIYPDQYEVNKKYHISDDVDFSNEKLDGVLIRKINSCHAEIDIENFSYLLRVVINIKADVILPCSYTLEDVPYVVKGEEEFNFTFEEENASEDLIYIPSGGIELNEYIYSLLIALVPPKVVKKGAKLSQEGKNYRVLTEEEYLKEKAAKKDSRWSKLDDIDFDDD